MRKAYVPVVVRKPIRERLIRPIAEFAQNEASSGMLLVACALAALIWANSPAAGSYFKLWTTPVSFGFGDAVAVRSLQHWINDGLMAVFFLLVGLEIKRELLIGELSTFKKASLPIFAALGGMVLPALIYASFNRGGAAARGWGVPMATDIAFALGVLALLGKRIPLSLRVFLAAVAIVDDLGAVMVIALFYTGEIQWLWLAGGLGFFGMLVLLNRFGFRQPVSFIIPGIGLWICFLCSGVHATIAGVLLAMTIPTRVHLDPVEFTSEAREALEEFESRCEPGNDILMNEERQAAVRELEKACEKVQMPLERIEDVLHPWVTFLVIPLFAVANAGVSLSGGLAPVFNEGIGLGVLLGLVLGKPLGICLFSYVAVRLGFATLPDRVSWPTMIGTGIVAGIGFTMSLFIAELAFQSEASHDAAKVAILAASVLAGVVGLVVLRLGLGKPAEAAS